jgi:hypothetical protein
MSFESGRVTFCRFRVHGDTPSTVDDAFLSILSESKFREHEIGTPDEVEVGFVTGVHLFDTQFSFEKNGYGPGGSVALFSLRMDTHKVPAEIKRAYKKMNEQAAAAGNPTGFASKSEKREANETANEQVREELASGKHRKSKLVPLMWDLRSGLLYCGSTSNTVIEHVARQMRQAFAVELDHLSSGVLAGDRIKAQGRSRDYEDLKPSLFTDAPTASAPSQDTDESAVETSGGGGFGGGPSLPWIARSVDLKDYLGNEFLMWLWWKTETGGGGVETESGEVFVALDKALDMDCAWERTGKQTLRGDTPTRLPEAADALATGKWLRKAGLIVADAERQWELMLQGDAMSVGSAAMPEADGAQTQREVIEARVGMVIELSENLDRLYEAFLARRASGPWSSDRDAIRKWIKDRRKTAVATRPTQIESASTEPIAV